MRRNVPFFANTDSTHCYQAVLAMILKYFEPGRNFTWQALDTISAKVEGLWTWPMASELWLQTHGYEVKVAGSFDYERFAREGEAYLIERHGADVAKIQIAHSDIAQERRLAKEFAAKGTVQAYVPEVVDVIRLVDKGWLVIINLNSCRLNDAPGFVGHFVLVVGHDGDELLVHDPGGSRTPGHAYRRVPRERFEAAWADPAAQAKGYTAVKKRIL